MGNLTSESTPGPRAIEQRLSWGPVVRGFRWSGGTDSALLLHEPGADLDAWAHLPAHLARQLEIETVAIDLPGHGLSDSPWDPSRLADLLRELPATFPTVGRRFVITAGASALASLDHAADLRLSGLVCLSPESPSADRDPPRSPTVPKLILASSLAGRDLDIARRLASTCGGWAVVTSIPFADRGTRLLSSPWSGRLIEQIVTFLRDCQQRPVRANDPPARAHR